MIREQKKAQILASVSKSAQIKANKTINVISGEPHLFELDANNPYSKTMKFKVAIDDEDHKLGLIKDQELNLVDNSKSEWEYWHSLGMCTKQNNWKIIKNDKKEMELGSGEQCKLLFKFQSFREPVFDYGVDKKDEADPFNELRPRQIKIEITAADGSVVQQLMINIQPKEMICDQVFRFYEA